MNLEGAVGEVAFTLSITRKETGKTETYQMVGFLDEEKLKALQSETPKETS